MTIRNLRPNRELYVSGLCSKLIAVCSDGPVMYRPGDPCILPGRWRAADGKRPMAAAAVNAMITRHRHAWDL